MPIWGHRNPRYLINRLRLEIYQRTHPDEPWIAPQAIALLRTLLLPTDIGLEWGSGRSTPWFARRLKQLTSVEPNPEWYAKIRQRLQEEGLTNVDYVLAALPDYDSADDSDYVRVIDRFSDGSLGLVVVDGGPRDKCAMRALPKIKPGGLLVFDNANWFFDHPTSSPNSRVGKGAISPVCAEVQKELSTWRAIWTSQGVSDTAIWIRP